MNNSDSGGRLSRFISILAPPPSVPPDRGASKLTDEDFERENKELFYAITHLSNQRMSWAKSMHGHLIKSFVSLKIMCVIAYAVGLVLLVVPFFAFYLSESHDPELLWFSGFGLAETLALLVYGPIQRIQKATSDMMQSTMILSSWATQMGMILYLLELRTIKGVKEISGNANLIRESTEAHVALLQKHAE